MRLILFDRLNDSRSHFYPIALSRPIWELRCGITSLAEKLIAKTGARDIACFVPPYLADVYREQSQWSINDPASLTGDDLLLVNGVSLYLTGGEKLCGRTTIVTKRPPLAASVEDLKNAPLDTNNTRYIRNTPRPGSDPMSAGALRELLDKNPSSNVYYLYADPYQFQDNLYRSIFGKERQNRTDIDYLLSTGDVGRELDLGLRNSGLKLIDRKKLLAALEKRNLP